MAYYSEREIRLARSFIKAMGGNAANGNLLIAVVAWQRSMRKNHETFWRSLSRLSAVRAGQLLAARLKSRARLDPRHYRGVLAALRRGEKASGYADQAYDFLTALRLSTWDRHHYGYKAATEGHWEYKWEYGRGKVSYWIPATPEYDPLITLWKKISGHNIPKRYFVDRVVTRTPGRKAKPPPPSQPRSLIHVQPAPDYIAPYAARNFYESRPHLGQYVLPEW